MSFRMHQAPEVTLPSGQTSTPVIIVPARPKTPPAPQIDVNALQMQLVALQQQVSQLQAAQNVPKPVVAKPNMKINVLQPTPAPISGLQLPQNEVVLLSMGRSPCASPRGSPCPSPR